MSNTDLTVGSLSGNSYVELTVGVPEKSRSLSEILDEPNSHSSILAVLEPIKIHSHEGALEDELEEDLFEDAESETRAGHMNNAHSPPHVAPALPARPKPPLPSREPKQSLPESDRPLASKDSSNTTLERPIRPERPKTGRSKCSEVTPTVDEQGILFQTIKLEGPNKRKPAPSRPERPVSHPGQRSKIVSSIGKKPSAPLRPSGPENSEGASSDVVSKHGEESKCLQRPGRPLRPAVPKPFVREKEDKTTVVAEKEDKPTVVRGKEDKPIVVLEKEDKTIVAHDKQDNMGSDMGSVPDMQDKPTADREKENKLTSKIKQTEYSLRKRLGSMKGNKKQQV